MCTAIPFLSFLPLLIREAIQLRYLSLQPSIIGTYTMARRKSKGLSTFEKLPVEIRRKIYGELLKANRVRQPPDHLLVCNYHFQAAILGVNKQINREAHDMLYQDNRFIVVSCNWEMICEVMGNHEVAAIACSKSKLVSSFKVAGLMLHF